MLLSNSGDCLANSYVAGAGSVMDEGVRAREQQAFVQAVPVDVLRKRGRPVGVVDSKPRAKPGFGINFRRLYPSRGRPPGSKDSAPRKRRDTVSESIPIACHGIDSCRSESEAVAPSVPIAVPIPPAVAMNSLTLNRVGTADFVATEHVGQVQGPAATVAVACGARRGLEKPRRLYASRGRPRGSKDSAPRKLRRDTVSEPIPIACHGIHSESAALAPSSAAAVPIAVPIVAPALRAVLVPRHLIAQPDSVLAPTLVFGSLVYGLAHHSTTSTRSSIQLAGGVTLEAPSAAVSTWLLPPNVLSDGLLAKLRAAIAPACAAAAPETAQCAAAPVAPVAPAIYCAAPAGHGRDINSATFAGVRTADCVAAELTGHSDGREADVAVACAIETPRWHTVASGEVRWASRMTRPRCSALRCAALRCTALHCTAGLQRRRRLLPPTRIRARAAVEPSQVLSVP